MTIGKSLSRLAGASNGGSATVTLSPASPGSRQLPPGLRPVRVTVSANSHGAYTTTFVLDPEAKQDGALKVKVEVQVWWLWPLLVLLVGAAAGYLTRWLMGSYRDRNVLKARLIDSRHVYAEHLRGRSPGVYPLRTWFGEFDEPIPKIPLRRERDRDGQHGWVEAWFEVERARSAAEVEQASKRVEGLVSDIAVWRKINDALKSLDVTFQGSVPDADVRVSAIPAYADTNELVSEQRFPQPKDMDEAEPQIEALALQAQIVIAYERARVAWNALPHDTTDHDENDPKGIYGPQADVLHRSADDAMKLIAKLKAAAEALEHEAQQRRPSHSPSSALGLSAALPPGTPMEGLMVQRTLATSPEHVLADVTTEDLKPAAPEGALPTRAPDPRKIRRAISAIDWMVFLATLLVSAVLYLLTLYVGKHFGAPSQYVEAFAAGFGGQALVGVATMPLARSLITVGKQSS